MDKKQFFLIAVLVVASLLGGNRAVAQGFTSQPTKNDTVPRRAAQAGDFQVPSDEEIQLLRNDFRSQRKQIVAANMDLTDAEAEKFWPIYAQYTADLDRINDTKAALIRDYLQNYITMSGDQAESYIRKRAAVEESVTQLRLKYIPVFRKVMSGRQTAVFFQIDWRLSMIIDLQLASQMPLLGN
jgi:hypothetical protein